MNNIPDNAIEICYFVIVERKSKKGNTYKCILAIDVNDNEHFVCFVK